jgi:protein arginine N-methyltransferase 5
MAMATKDGDKAKETPFVVLFQAVTEISDDGGGLRGQCGDTVQVAWEFEHPRKDVVLDPKGTRIHSISVWHQLTIFGVGLPITNTHNIRSAHLTFHIPHASTLHGLAGYFEAVLYGDIGLSIHPQRKDKISPDMFSWFPIFFPFKVQHRSITPFCVEH